MREILFRGKSIKDNKWAYGFYVEADMSYIYSIDDKNNIIKTPVKYETVSQYVGMDVNDIYPKRIRVFEGDILRLKFKKESMKELNSELGLVKYKDSNVYFYVDCKKTNSCIYIDEFDINSKVIGNIWDNPELLKYVY